MDDRERLRVQLGQCNMLVAWAACVTGLVQMICQVPLCCSASSLLLSVCAPCAPSQGVGLVHMRACARDSRAAVML